MEELVRLTGADYEQAIDFLDLVFSQARKPHHFERALPRMCVPDDEHMGKHFAIKVNGRIEAMLGVYPLPMVIDGERFLFSTTGNVATHYRYEGRGYAHKLLNRAMEELKDIGADASRLGGFRQRYNRFGFEMAGTAYNMSVEANNVKWTKTAAVRFEPIARTDGDTIAKVQKLQAQAPFYADRGDAEGFYRVMTAWEGKPFAAYDEQDQFMGCLCVSPDSRIAAEIIARDAEATEAIVVQWLAQGRTPVLNVTLPPWNLEAVRRISRFCQNLNLGTPSQFKIINWQGIANALCRIQSRLVKLPDGSFTLGILDGPTLRFTAEGGVARCEAVEGAVPDLTLDSLAATRFLFGPQAPWTVAPLPGPMAAALLPLPLTWCGQDRV